MYCSGVSKSFFMCFFLCSCSTMMVLLKFRSLGSSRISNRGGYVPPSMPIFWNLYLK